MAGGITDDSRPAVTGQEVAVAQLPEGRRRLQGLRVVGGCALARGKLGTVSIGEQRVTGDQHAIMRPPQRHTAVCMTGHGDDLKAADRVAPVEDQVGLQVLTLIATLKNA